MIDILLATYNGARFLPAQIDSILGQTYQDWRLLIRDDGSTDATLEIIDRYAGQHPGRIEVIRDGRPNLGVAGNFSTLMERSDADCIMFCDQDDVWLPEKVAESHAAMQELELRYGSDTPLLVHTNLSVVDQDLKLIHRSFWRYQKLDPERGRSLVSLLVQNVVTGCAAMANRRLKDMALPLPHDVRMHDWWLALVAAAFGCCDYVPRPLVLYRQHGANILGAKDHGALSVFLSIAASPISILRQKRLILRTTQVQARAFLAIHQEKLSPACKDAVMGYAYISEKGFWSRRVQLVRRNYWLGSFVKNVGLFVLI